MERNWKWGKVSPFWNLKDWKLRCSEQKTKWHQLHLAVIPGTDQGNADGIQESVIYFWTSQSHQYNLKTRFSLFIPFPKNVLACSPGNEMEGECAEADKADGRLTITRAVRPYCGWFLRERRKGVEVDPGKPATRLSQSRFLGSHPWGHHLCPNYPSPSHYVCLFHPQTLNSSSVSQKVLLLEAWRLVRASQAIIPQLKPPFIVKRGKYNTYTSATLQTHTLHSLAVTDRRNIHWYIRPFTWAWLVFRLSLAVFLLDTQHLLKLKY